jgi:hypothetical protein
MFKKISVLIPTRGRVERLKTLLRSYEATATGDEDHSELIFRVDEDDRPTVEFFATLNKPYIRAVVVGSRLQGYKSMPAFFNEMLTRANGDVLLCGNDDMVFRTPSWASRILAKANEYPDGLFNIGVSVFNADHYPWCIVSRMTTHKLGFLWDPRIYWGDIFLRDVMGALERTVMLPEVQIDHEWAGHAPDATFAQADQESIFRDDPTYWTGTHATAVAEAVERLKASRKGISYIVPTCGRPSLQRTIDSLETWPGDEILLVGDFSLRLAERDFVRKRPEIKVVHCPPGNDWGSTERNYVTPLATGAYLCFMDDDDTQVPGTRGVLESAMNGNPSIFRMQYANGHILWDDPEIRCGNVGTPMVFVPNVLDRIGQWGPNVGGDCDYMFRLKWQPHEITFRREVICYVRPQ